MLQTQINFFQSKCKGKCFDDGLMKLLETEDSHQIYYLHQFWLFLVLLVIGRIAKSVITSLGDTICYEIIGETFLK